MKIETVTNQLCVLGEGPVWDAARNEIIWVDIIEGAIHQYSFDNESLKTFSVGDLIGCVAICANGDLVFASKSGIGLLNRNTGTKKILYHPETHLPNNRFNDGKCDVAGRLWAGTMAIDETIGAGSVYVNDLQKPDKKINNTTISNGIAWNADNTILYFIDTPTFEVVSYQFNKITSDISDRKVVIQIPQEDGHPDGMTIDTEGMLWIAHWDGWQITRWDPGSGEKLYHIKLPVSRVTSCTFGGPELKDLFITSARKGLTEEELKNQPLAGALFVIRNCGYQGLPAFEFNNLN
jgi:sugar lactone lactonase YvrE